MAAGHQGFEVTAAVGNAENEHIFACYTVNDNIAVNRIASATASPIVIAYSAYFGMSGKQVKPFCNGTYLDACDSFAAAFSKI